MAEMNPVATTNRQAVVTKAAGVGITLEEADQRDRGKLLTIATEEFKTGEKWWEGEENTKNVMHYKQSEKDFAKRKLKCVVAKEGRKIVGYIFYQPEGQRKNEVYTKELGVSHACQGKGIGTFLLAWVAGEARDNGRSAIKLYTSRGKDSKESFYNKWGFAGVKAEVYDKEGYTTDEDKNPGTQDLLMSGDVKTVWGTLATKLKIQ